MGLDIVEFIVAVEDAFELVIPNAVAERLTTPRRLIDYLTACLPPALDDTCLSQRAFYNLRDALHRRLGLRHEAWRPSTSLFHILPESDRDQLWRQIGYDMRARHWPRVGKPGWFERPTAPRLSHLGEVASFLAERASSSLKRAGEGWTRNQVAGVIRRLLWSELRIDEYSEDDRFVQDLGVG